MVEADIGLGLLHIIILQLAAAQLQLLAVVIPMLLL